MITFYELRVDSEHKELLVDVGIDNGNPGVVIDSIFVDSADTFVPNGPSNNPLYVKHIFEGSSDNKRVRLFISQAELGVSVTNNIFFVYVIASHIDEITKKRTHFSLWTINNENFDGYVGDTHAHFSNIKYGNSFLLGKVFGSTVIKVSGLQDGQHLYFGSLDEEDGETVNIIKDGIYPISTKNKFRGFYTDFVGECDIDIYSLSDGFKYTLEEGREISCVGIKRMGTVVDMSNLYTQSMAYIRTLEKNCGNHKQFADWILRLSAFELAIKTGNYSTAIEYWNKYLSTGSSNTSSTTQICNCNG